MNPKISVVMPLYNAEKFLEKVLESVFHQTYPAHEIIVVDDGSTDSCPEILKRYAGRIRTARIPNSGSPSAPLNVALQMVTGDYVAFLDNDDFWFKNYLERNVEFIRKFPEIGVFSSNFAVRRPDSSAPLKRNLDLVHCRKELNFNGPLQTDAFKLLLRENFAGISSNVLVRQDIANRVGNFDDGKKYSEDYDYLLRCARVSRFLLISDLLVFKKTHPGNITSDLLRMNIKHVNVLLKIRPLLNSMEGSKGLIEECGRASAVYFYIIGNDLFTAGKVQEAFTAYANALSSHKVFSNLLSYSWVMLRRGLRLLLKGRPR